MNGLDNNFTTNIDDYELQDDIGVGGTAVVIKATHKPTNQKCAIKRILQDHFESNMESIQKEIALMSSQRHENIINFYKTFLDTKTGTMYIVMPLMTGSLQDLVRTRTSRPEFKATGNTKPPFDDKEIASISKYVLAALEHMHKSKLIHRDVKATNIFINSEGQVILGDYGIAKMLRGCTLEQSRASFRDSTTDPEYEMTLTGTPVFMAPDIQNEKYDEKVDIWSLGIVLHILAFGNTPFGKGSAKPMQILVKIVKLKSGEELMAPPYHENCNIKISKDLKDFILECTTIDPAKRKSAYELLKHKFLKNAKGKEFLSTIFTKQESEIGAVARDMAGLVIDREKKTYQAPSLNRYQSGRFKFNLDDDDEDDESTIADLGPASRFKTVVVEEKVQEFAVSKTINCTLKMRNSDEKDSLQKISFECVSGDTASKIIGEMVQEGLISDLEQGNYESSLNDYLMSGGVTQCFKVNNLKGRAEDKTMCVGYSKFTSQTD